jgi:transcription initiation factor TFIIB
VDNFQPTTSTNAHDLVIRFCSQLGLNKHIFVKVSQALAQKVSTSDYLAGRSPLSVAAACIYMASHLLGQPKTAKEISSMAGVSDGTIRTAYKFLYNDREKLIDPDWLTPAKGGNMDRLPTS